MEHPGRFGERQISSGVWLDVDRRVLYRSWLPGGRTGEERVEVFAGKARFVIEDYSSLRVSGVPARGLEALRVENGQREPPEDFWRVLEGDEELLVTAEDGYCAMWCAEKAVSNR